MGTVGYGSVRLGTIGYDWVRLGSVIYSGSVVCVCLGADWAAPRQGNLTLGASSHRGSTMGEPIGQRSMRLNQDNRRRRVSPRDVCSRVWLCFVCSSRSFSTCSAVLTTVCFYDYPLVYIIYLKVSHNLVIYIL